MNIWYNISVDRVAPDKAVISLSAFHTHKKRDCTFKGRVLICKKFGKTLLDMKVYIKLAI